MFNKIFFSVLFSLFFAFFTNGQEKQISETIRWTGIETFTFGNEVINILHFEDAMNDDAFGMLPVFTRLFPVNVAGKTWEFAIVNPTFVPLDVQSTPQTIMDIELVPDELNITSEIITIRKSHFSQLKLLPLRKNSETGEIEKLIAFEIEAKLSADPDYKTTRVEREYAENSVLAAGDWYKFKVSETGIYKLTFEDLTGMGMDFTGVSSSQIQVFGNGGKMLSERNSDFRYDDLQEIAIFVEDGGNGVFGQGDHILFYGEGALSWNYIPIRLAFEHQIHQYSEHNYYFITIGEGEGKRIQLTPQIPVPADQIINNYNHFETYSLNAINLIKSGAAWYSDEFSEVVSRDYHFSFPKRDTNESVFFAADFAARSFTQSSFDVYVNDDLLLNVPIGPVPQGSVSRFGNGLGKTQRFGLTDSQDVTITVDYNKPGSESRGWLNYIDVNIMNRLEFDGGQMDFRNIYTIYNGLSAEFRIANANVPLTVWNVTNHLEAEAIEVTHTGDICSFKLETSELLEFVAFDHTEYYQPNYIGKIENQNLHALSAADFIIVSHPDFIEQAERLKALHEDHDQMTIHLVTPQQIYNEFSSGKQDPSAIRDFVKMIYDRSGDPPSLKYLLLFGDGSYDAKDRIPDNRNFIVTFQSRQSLMYTTSYVTDDFYGLMDHNEGYDAVGNVDIGIGRLAANTPEQAKNLVDKIERYMIFGPENAGHWRNSICFIADDGDHNLHLFQADTVLVNIVTRNNQSINVNKIYLDAYQHINTSAGKRYPDVNAAINDQVNRGTLFINYTGHGGEIALASERVVQIPDILSWDNKYKMPVFITATCEFTPYDNPGTVSAGELVVLNPDGGGVALMSTTRIAFASSNLTLNRRIYDTLFRAEPGNYPRLGDLIMFSKNPSSTNIRNFTLLGNPALKLALPEHNIIIDSINGMPVELVIDTIHANSMVSFSGYVASHFNGEQLTGFNGNVYPVLYDKAKTITTLGADQLSYPYDFELQQDILYEGKASVTEGRFSFSFVVPRNISYNYGEGKLSLYATSETTDASGHFNQFILGGILDDGLDNTGPEITLFMNDEKFINGMMVNNNPIMVAHLHDPSGINAIGAGIGHDIVATLNGPVNTTIIMNPHFKPTIDDYRSGSIVYPFNNLSNGDYTLEIRASDMKNNSTSATIQFTVSNNIVLQILEAFNYPNPFNDHTWFSFRHNQFDKPLEVEINIYDVSGSLVNTIGPGAYHSNGYYIEPISWSGTSAGGSKLKPGFYIYTIDVKSHNNIVSRMVQKLIISD